MKTYLALLGLFSFAFVGVSCDTVDEDHTPHATVTRETTTTIDPLTGTANTSTTTTSVERRHRDHDHD